MTAVAAQSAGCTLDYVSVEIAPISDEVLSELLHFNFPQQQQLVDAALSAVKAYKQQGFEKRESGRKSKQLLVTDHSGITEQISFQLILDDALTTDFGKYPFNAVYLDAFSPKNNPELWAAPFLRKIKKVLADKALLVSYCVSRSFRDGLTDAGFKWQKVAGPPGKREVLIASIR